ncbi:MAG: HAMP domain-containing histidine kinase [Prevotella sp.]|nr:HAMP domain-containing histidine kinase [Prevotella sp.]
MYPIIIIIIAILLIVFLIWLAYHQKTLKQRAYLMKEAIRNKDFMFRISTKGLLPGERALQQALNEMGETMADNIKKNEVEAWERLMRVLTHEIMNATAPISSISQAMLSRDDVRNTPLEDGIRAINATANHLNVFVDSYRKLTQLQNPVMETVAVKDMVAEIIALYPEIAWDTNDVVECDIYTDSSMLRQVLINLIKNAVEAKADKMAIEAKCIESADGNRHLAICVSNNGTPIPPEVASTIFVPFFTTKSSGTGIGLSLSRQLMSKLGGSIELLDYSRTSYITTFRLQLPVAVN